MSSIIPGKAFSFIPQNPDGSINQWALNEQFKRLWEAVNKLEGRVGETVLLDGLEVRGQLETTGNVGAGITPQVPLHSSGAIATPSNTVSNIFTTAGFSTFLGIVPITTYSYIRIVLQEDGPEITGFSSGTVGEKEVDGRLLFVQFKFNPDLFYTSIALKHDAASDPVKGIYTKSGSDLTLNTTTRGCWFIYDATLARWILMGT